MKKDRSTAMAVLALMALSIAILAGMLVQAQLVYHDWTCAFARCVRVVP